MLQSGTPGLCSKLSIMPNMLSTQAKLVKLMGSNSMLRGTPIPAIPCIPAMPCIPCGRFRAGIRPNPGISIICSSSAASIISSSSSLSAVRYNHSSVNLRMLLSIGAAMHSSALCLQPSCARVLYHTQEPKRQGAGCSQEAQPAPCYLGSGSIYCSYSSRMLCFEIAARQRLIGHALLVLEMHVTPWPFG